MKNLSIWRSPWAMLPDAISDLRDRAEHLDIDLWADADPALIEAMYAARPSRAAAGAVGVVSILGPITRRDSMMSLYFGGTSATRIIQQVGALAADDTVATILLNVDSPGGEARGMSEAAAAIRKARESKKVVTLANGTMASAAAWLGWQADEVIATPDAVIGSQGVYTVHVDTSKALEMAGIKPTYVGSSDAKTAGRDGMPLDDATRAEMQGIVDELDRLFKADTAAGRGVTVAQVKAQFGNGAVFNAREAKNRGMVDSVATYGAALSRLSGVRSEAPEPAVLAAVDDDEPLPDDVIIVAGPDSEAERAARLLVDDDAWRFRRRS